MSEGIHNHLPLWGEWQIDSVIGKGSYGEVYRIYKEVNGQRIYAAAKYISVPAGDKDKEAVINRGLASDEMSLRKYFDNKADAFMKETDLMLKLRKYPSIVRYEDHIRKPKSDDIGWDIIIRMELLEALDKYLRRKPFTQRDVVKMGIDICNAIESCRIEKVIHRDVKIENIFLDSNGNYKLGDFGVSRETQGTTHGTMVGTEDYMAPEIIKHEEYSYNVDVYSIGIVMYRLLNNNRIPFLKPDGAINQSDYAEAMSKILSGKYKLPSPKFASGKLADIILKACAYDRRKRYAKASDMAKDLMEIWPMVTDDIVRAPLGFTGSTGDATIADSRNSGRGSELSSLGSLFSTNETISESVGSSRTEMPFDTGGSATYDGSATVSELDDRGATVAEISSQDSTLSEHIVIEEKNSAKRSNWKKLLIPMIIVLLFGGVAAGFYFFSSGSDVSDGSQDKIVVIRGLDEEFSLMVDGTAKLKPRISPEGTEGEFTYESDDESIVTVDEDGLVTAIAPGEAIVTVTFGNESEEIKVTVTEFKNPATAIYPPDNKVLTVGAEETLESIVMPADHTDGAVVYTSSDPTIVSVDGYTIKALKAGNVTITATVGGVSGSFDVTVNAATKSNDSKPVVRCSVCGSTSHTVHPKPAATCSVCGSTSHTVHPTCPTCGSTSHTVHPTPTCPTCGSTSHTVHPSNDEIKSKGDIRDNLV